MNCDPSSPRTHCGRSDCTTYGCQEGPSGRLARLRATARRVVDDRVLRLPPTGARGRWERPWFHFCLFDPQCREAGAPWDLYIHPLRMILRLGEGRNADLWDDEARETLRARRAIYGSGDIRTGRTGRPGEEAPEDMGGTGHSDDG